MNANRTDASQALLAYALGDVTHLFSCEGSSRVVYLINGVIYKVDLIEGTNELEYSNIVNAQPLPAGVFYPEVDLFYFDNHAVIAMEYVEGTPIYQCLCDMAGDECDSVCMTPQECDFLCPLLDDPSGSNVIRNEHGYYIIDAA